MSNLASNLKKIVLLVHNIDGKSLRNPDAQNVLSVLAGLKRVFESIIYLV